MLSATDYRSLYDDCENFSKLDFDSFLDINEDMCYEVLKTECSLFGGLLEEHLYDAAAAAAEEAIWDEQALLPPSEPYSDDDIDLGTALISDCMWTSPRKTPFVQFRNAAAFDSIKMEPDLENLVGPPDLLLGVSYDADNFGNCNLRNCAPYTVGNEHSYFKVEEPAEQILVKVEPPSSPPSLPAPAPVAVRVLDPSSASTSSSYSYFSETPTTTDSEDELMNYHDVLPVITIKMQQPPQLSGRPKRVTTGRLGPRETAAVHAKLVQARKLQQSGKVLTRTVRRRRPANSLNSSSSNSHSNSDNEEPEKRVLHNKMERHRRQAQRSALHCLRVEIPELEHDLKAPKVKIIQFGTKYVRKVTQIHEGLIETKRQLLERNMALKMKLEICRSRFRR